MIMRASMAGSPPRLITWSVGPGCTGVSRRLPSAWGMIPIPKKLVKQGVRDMLRISDARMSGTSYGACVLHVAPEAYVGGPLALVRSGDIVSVDIPARRIALEISDEELARRKAGWNKPAPRYERSYGAIFSRHVKQANEGCDFDFLEGTAPTAEPEIH